MSMLSTLKTDDSIANERDSLGNGGPVESGLYLSTITLAYLSKAKSEALALNLHVKTESGREIREQIWVTSGKEKGCKNYYEDKDGAKQYLPGFLTANAIALLTVGKELSELEPEDKVVPLYSADAKAEVPTKVPMLTELIGQQVLLGVIKETVDKQVKNDAGVYVPNGETRDQNTIDKVFRARDRMTTTEIRGQAKEAAFADQWDAKWTGNTRNRAKGAGAAGTAGAPKAAQAAAAKKPTTSLFA